MAVFSSKNIPEKERTAMINRLGGLLGVKEESKKEAIVAILDDWLNQVHKYATTEPEPKKKSKPTKAELLAMYQKIVNK